MNRTRSVGAVLAGAATVMLALSGMSPATAALTLPGIVSARLDSVQVSGTTVTLKWTDRSTTEDAFVVLRRASGSSNNLQRSDNHSASKAGTGQTYTVTDTIPAGTRQCYGIMNYDYQGVLGGDVSNEVCTSALPALSAPALGDGIASSLDTAVTSGLDNSNAIGSDGLGITAYYQGGVGGNVQNLRVSHCEDTECTFATTHDIDTVGDVGRFTSIKIGSDGLPLISYQSYRNASHQFTQDLKVAHCVDIACSSATITTLDSAATVDLATSLTIASDGRGSITYADSSSNFNTMIKVAHCANVVCTTATTRVVDTVGKVSAGGVLSIATSPTGLQYIAYQDATTLKVAACFSNDCGSSSTQITTVYIPGATETAGQDPSISIGRDGLPLISHRQSTVGGSHLIVAHCVNIYCSGVTQKVVTTGVSTGSRSSIAIGADGFGVVSYNNAATDNLEVAHCANLECTNVTHVTLLDEFGDLGHGGTSVAIGMDGLPLVSYYDITNTDLKVAHCADAACAEPLIAPFFKKK